MWEKGGRRGMNNKHLYHPGPRFLSYVGMPCMLHRGAIALLFFGVRSAFQAVRRNL
jgi:hypothetical protein